ncbi:glycosyltransferase [Lentisphaera araneosa HTCC2155]|jgi:glycosyltransferase involved in cell wall biosynthesis|uniref:Glycosyltransferase n=1 Tax=Lentisphaera araneosa HTCC2155 TaxID=313628 RepID=A6DHF5_9BACT|nr:glycosyltransferase [Lentisphaera araneosa]EDM29038.1 glycosyltransferase [Lentisphaera araneosa HTCC2155]
MKDTNSKISPKQTPDLSILTKDTGWYGGHSGFYEQLGKRLKKQPFKGKIFKPKNNLPSKILGRLNNMRFGKPYENDFLSSAQLNFYHKTRNKKNNISCVLNMDDNWQLLKHWKSVPKSLVGVIHIPTSQWAENGQIHTSKWFIREGYEMCHRLKSAIVLWEREIPKIEQLVGPGRVAFVPHGIDTNFFHPGNKPRKKISFLACGQYLRDFDMLQSIFENLQNVYPEVELRIVIPKHFLKIIDLSWAEKNSNVTIISGLSDEELLTEYQLATALLIPFIDSGANNATMEAMACGCPIVSNDIGGIRSYGGGSVYPIGNNSDDLVKIALNLIENSTYTIEMSHKLRSYSLNFDWEKVAPLFYSTVNDLASQ